MPRYHFHLLSGANLVEDEEGRELADLGTAEREAIKGIRSVVAAEALSGSIDLRSSIDVADDGGRILLTIRFADAILLSP